jgi:hypothetical protein
LPPANFTPGETFLELCGLSDLRQPPGFKFQSADKASPDVVCAAELAGREAGSSFRSLERSEPPLRESGRRTTLTAFEDGAAARGAVTLREWIAFTDMDESF